MAVRADAGYVDKTAHIGFLSGAGESLGCVDGITLELVPWAPVTDAGGGMIDGVYALTWCLESGGIGEVGDDFFHAEGVEEGGVGGGTDDDADGLASFYEFFDNVTAEQSGGTSD